MKVNKICNLDHPCILKLFILVFCYIYISEHFIFCSITHMGDSILKQTLSTFSKWLPERLCVQYYNMASFPVWLQIQYG